jgi:sec-independent protein translocase protein TatC
VVIFFLARVGMIDHRFLIRHYRYAIVLIALLAAILTPPDLVAQLLLMVPLGLLYGIGIGVAYFARRKNDSSDD